MCRPDFDPLGFGVGEVVYEDEVLLLGRHIADGCTGNWSWKKGSSHAMLDDGLNLVERVSMWAHHFEAQSRVTSDTVWLIVFPG
jgi:hypothetical protein